MSGEFFNLHNPQALQCLWLLLPLAALFALNLRRRNRVLRLFIERSLLENVNPGLSISRPMFKFAILLAGLTILVFALARPRWNPREVELARQGQNILFCLDVSNSMRARDVDPSRLQAAKASIRRLINKLPAGNQGGLLAYAGSAQLECPLTPNYSHFLSILDRVDYDSVDLGGSNLGDAIYKATHNVFGLEAEDTKTKTDKRDQPEVGETVMESEDREPEDLHNVLVVLSDGENHEGHARAMAAEAHKLGMGIYIIGLGSKEGAPIPIQKDGRETMLQYKGKEVITRLEDESLRNILQDFSSRAGYLSAAKANVDLVDIYNRVIAKQGKREQKFRYTIWQEKFQLFAGIGMALVMLAGLIREQKPTQKAEDAH